MENFRDVNEGEIDRWNPDLEARNILSQSDGQDGDRWIDLGIQDVSVAGLPQPEDIHGAEDFKKVSMEDMREGLNRLERMRPLIDSGADADYWREFDSQQNLNYEHGYQRVYESFYGNDAIRLNKDGDQWDIVNGRHRIFLAREMGLSTLPARVIERQ